MSDDDQEVDFFGENPYEPIGLMVMWPDGSISTGQNPTYLLLGLCGGWNPPTIPALRRELAKRSGIPAPRGRESDRTFLQRLEAAGTIKIFDVNRHFPEILLERKRAERD